MTKLISRRTARSFVNASNLVALTKQGRRLPRLRHWQSASGRSHSAQPNKDGTDDQNADTDDHHFHGLHAVWCASPGHVPTERCSWGLCRHKFDERPLIQLDQQPLIWINFAKHNGNRSKPIRGCLRSYAAAPERARNNSATIGLHTASAPSALARPTRTAR